MSYTKGPWAVSEDGRAIEFDFEAAYQYMKDRAAEFNLNETYSAMVAIHKLKDRNNKLLYFRRNKTNYRIDTNLTSLPSYLKQFITSFSNGIQIDLKNSQPVLFNILLNHISSSNNNSSFNLTENIIKSLPLCCVNNDIISSINLINKEIKKNRKWVEILLKEISIYRQETMNGTWYEYLMKIYNDYHNTTEYDKPKVKDMWMAIAYSHNYSTDYKEDKIPFQKAFPALDRLIYLFKAKNYKQFPILLQQIEANIFIDLIAKELIENGIKLYTVHDSVIIDKSDLELTQNLIDRILIEKLGFKPRFEVKALKDITERKPRQQKKAKSFKKKRFRKKATPFFQLKQKVEVPAVTPILIPSVEEMPQNETTSDLRNDNTTIKATEPTMDLSLILNEFIARDKSFFIRSVGRSETRYNELVEVAKENDFKKLYAAMNEYSFMEEVKNKFLEFYLEYSSVAA